MSKQLRPSSVKKAIDLLSSTKTTITMHGRPRRRPNIDQRPEAVSQSGKQVSPYSPGADRWSLPGAFKADSKALGYTNGITKLAQAYFVAAYREVHPFTSGKSIAQIDALEFDTREITRALQRAIVMAGEQLV